MDGAGSAIAIHSALFADSAAGGFRQTGCHRFQSNAIRFVAVPSRGRFMTLLRMFFFIALTTTLAGAQQIITLRDGTRYTGRLIQSTPQSITFADQNGREHTVNADQVQSIEFSQDRPAANYPRSAEGDQHYRDEGPVLAAGTQIAVRVNEDIDSRTANPNQTYGATIDRDVVDDTGRVVIPRGSSAELVVRRASGGGAVGNSDLILDLEYVLVNGMRYRLDLPSVERQSHGGIGANRRTAEMVGGGALLGTLIGAIGGGGKGAAIGAVAGAAGGGTVQAITRGEQVRVPSETVLTFRLDQAERLYPARG